MISHFLHNFAFFVSAVMLSSGLYIMITTPNYIRKIMGLALFQNAVLVFYIALSKVSNAAPPILPMGKIPFTAPLPHVLMLTAIVVGFATMSVAFALVSKIHKNFGTINEDEISS